MGYKIGYTMQWKTMTDAQLMTLSIYDTYGGFDVSQSYEFTSMTPATDNPVSLGCIDNNESKTTAVRGTKCTIKFLGNEVVRLGTFAGGPSDRFLVEYKSGSNMIWTGYLISNGIQGAFLPSRTVITITATDNLALLDKIPLTKSTGVNPRGNYSLMDYIVMALKKTNLQLPIKVVLSLMERGSGVTSTLTTFTGPHSMSVIYASDFINYFRVGKRFVISGTASNNHFFTVTSAIHGVGTLDITVAESVTNESSVNATFTDANPCLLSNIFVEAKTFEATAINSSENCSTVITKILGSLKCFIKQYNGEWWIQAIDDFRYTNPAYFVFDIDGNIQSWGGGFANRDKEIGPLDSGYSIRVRDAATNCTIEQRQKFAKEIYKFDFWQEIICNVDFARGDFIQNVADEIIDNITYQVKQFTHECWTPFRGLISNINSGASVDFSSYIKKYFYNGYEKQRSLVIEKPADTSGTYWRYVRSEAVFIDKYDKFTWGFDYSAVQDNNINNPGLEIAIGATLLYGNDGSYWVLGDTGGPQWKLSNSSFNTNFDVYQWAANPASVDLTLWNSFSIEAPPAPIGGKLYFILFASPNTVSSASFDMRYANLSFSYIPFINGSYQRYTQESDTFTSTDNVQDSTEEEIFISGGVKKLFKGAMKYYSGSDVSDENNYFLATEFYNYMEGRTGGFLYDRFGKYIANEVWNQVKKETVIFQAYLQGIDATTNNRADMIHRFFIRHSFDQCINRIFLGVGMPVQNQRDQSWQLTLSEVYNSDVGYEFDNSKYQFKYE